MINTPAPLKAADKKFAKTLSRVPEIPGTMRALLGGQNVRDLVEILTSGEVLEADLLVAMGELPGDDLVQYTNLLPEYDQVDLKINAVVNKMVDNLKPKFKTMLAASKRMEKKGSIQALYNEINKLIGLLEHPLGGYRNLQVLRFLSQLYAQVFSALDSSASPQDVPVLAQVMLLLNQIWHHSFDGLDFIGAQFLNEKALYGRTLNDVSCQEAMGDLIALERPLTAEQRKSLEEEVALDFEEIKELREYRKIFFTSFQLGKARVAIMADDFIEKGESYSGICSFQIALRDDQPLRQPIVEMNGVRKTFDVGLRPGVFNFNLNRATGEITFTTGHGITITEVFSEDAYLLLKKRLFALALDYLRGKEPDIEDVFLPKVGAQRAETHQVVEEVLEEMEEPMADELPIQQIISWHFEKPSVEMVVPGQTVVEPDENQRRRKQEFIKKIRNLRPVTLMSILTRLMNEPVRTQGSHHFFRSPKNNEVLPIPFHGIKPVKFPLLKHCLEKWDMVEEFSLELGI